MLQSFACSLSNVWIATKIESEVCTLKIIAHSFSCVFAAHGSVDTSVHICEHNLRRMCTCARVCAVCSLTYGADGCWVQLVCAGHLLLRLALRIIFDRMIRVSSVCLLFVMGVGVTVNVCLCAYTRPNTHTARGKLRCEPRGRDETLEEPDSEESRCTQSQDTFICICV